MAKNLKFFWEYNSVAVDVNNRVEIYVEGFSGLATELDGASGLTINVNKDVGEKFLGGLAPNFYKLSAFSTSEFKAVEFKGENYGDAIVRFLEDDVLKFNAVIVPFEGMDLDAADGLFGVDLSAECGLNYLKTVDYPLQTGRKKLIEVLKTCLAKIPIIDTFNIEVIDNTFAFNPGFVPPVNYWDTYIDVDNFKGKDCLSVLTEIRKPYTEISFSNGAWIVRNIKELSTQNSLKNTYTWSTLAKTSSSYTRPTITPDRLSGNFGLLFSQKNLKISKGASVPKNQFPYGEFDNLTGWSFNGGAGSFYEVENGQLINSLATIHSPSFSGTDITYIESPSINFEPFSSIFVPGNPEKERLVIKGLAHIGRAIKNLRFQIIVSYGGVSDYLSSEGTWYTPWDSSPTPIYELKVTDGEEWKIELPQVPYHPAGWEATMDILNTGLYGIANNPLDAEIPTSNLTYSLKIRIFLPERVDENPASTVSEYGSFYEMKLDYMRVDKADATGNVSTGFTHNFGAEGTKDRQSDFTIDIGVGYPSYPIGLDCLFKDDSTTTQIVSYGEYNSITGQNIDEFIAKSYLDVLGNRLKTWEGTIIGVVRFGDLLLIDGQKYRIHNYSYDTAENMSTIKAIELASATNELILTIPEIDPITKSIIDDYVRQTIGTPKSLIFPDKNFYSSLTADGQQIIGLRNDPKYKSIFTEESFLKADGGGKIKDIAEASEVDFTLIKPAENGTYATREWTDEWAADNAWMFGGNVAAAALDFGTTSGDFDIRVLRNNVEVGKWRTGGLTVPTLIASNLTDNYVPRHTAAGLANSQIFNNGTNVGIGTTSPNARLDVNGAINTSGTYNISGNAFLQRNSDFWNYIYGYNNNVALQLGGTADPVNYYNNTVHVFRNQGVTEWMRINWNGNVGIGNINPAYKLDVTGTGHFTGAVTFDTVPSSLQDATSANHLVRYSQWIASTSVKYLPTAVKTVALTNITLSGTQTVNGVALIAGDRILVTGQTTGSANGVYEVAAGSWTRATDSDTDAELRGFIISVSGGTYAGYKYINTNATTITVGTTTITYSEFSNVAENDPIFTAWRDTTRTANTFWAAPNGSNGVATWRALVAADIPTLNQSTTGSAATLTTTRNIAMTGDVAWNVNFNGSANVTATGTLATVNSNIGTFRSVTVNAKGLVTAATNPSIALTTDVSGILPIANGGTGSSTKNFVDLTTSQLNIAGTKGFLSEITVKGIVFGTGNTSDSSNISIGVGSMQSLTTGHSSIALGGGSLAQNTSGIFNTAIGINALNKNTTGGDNTAIGYSSLDANTIGTRNVGSGVASLVFNTEGSNNVAIGYFSGGFSNSSSPLTTNSNSIFIGYAAKASANGNTNEVVIGYTGSGNGSNTVTLGNSSTVSNHFFGSIAYTTTLKPNNTTPTAGQFLKAPTTSTNAWAFIGHADISDLASFIGFDARYFTETESDARFQPIGSYLTGNQTITLSGIITGSGTTAITTAIADGVLSIAKTSGLQTALDSKMTTTSYPDLVAIEALVGTSGLLRKTGTNTWALDTATYLTSVALPNTQVGVGNGSNILSSSASFTYSANQIHLYGGTGGFNIGKGGFDNEYWVDADGTNLNLYGSRIVSRNNHQFNSGIYAGGVLGSSGQVLSSTGSGVQWVTPSAGGTLTDTYIGFGNGSNVLSGISTFRWLGGRYISITADSANFNFGGASGAGFIESVNGNLLLEARGSNGVVVNDGFFRVVEMGGTGAMMVTVDNNGTFGKQTIPSGGGSQNIDSVLGIGSIATNKSMVLKDSLGNVGYNFQNGFGTPRGGMAYNQFTDKVSVTGASVEISAGSGSLNLFSDTALNLGYSNTSQNISIQGTNFNFNEDALYQGGSAWGSGGSTSPQEEDIVVFRQTSGRMVMLKTNTIVASIGGLNYNLLYVQ